MSATEYLKKRMTNYLSNPSILEDESVINMLAFSIEEAEKDTAEIISDDALTNPTADALHEKLADLHDMGVIQLQVPPFKLER